MSEYIIKRLTPDLQKDILKFYQAVLPESGRTLDLNGRHQGFSDIEHCYDQFWCLYDDNELIGTVALKRIDKKRSELKALYLYNSYQGQGLGYMLLSRAVQCAKEEGYSEVYLDTLSTSERTIRLYRSVGFEDTKRYNDNPVADVFMVLNIAQ